VSQDIYIVLKRLGVDIVKIPRIQTESFLGTNKLMNLGLKSQLNRYLNYLPRSRYYLEVPTYFLGIVPADIFTA
jgi:hypothetical protein